MFPGFLRISCFLFAFLSHKQKQTIDLSLDKKMAQFLRFSFDRARVSLKSSFLSVDEFWGSHVRLISLWSNVAPFPTCFLLFLAISFNHKEKKIRRGCSFGEMCRRNFLRSRQALQSFVLIRHIEYIRAKLPLMSLRMSLLRERELERERCCDVGKPTRIRWPNYRFLLTLDQNSRLHIPFVLHFPRPFMAKVAPP